MSLKNNNKKNQYNRIKIQKWINKIKIIKNKKQLQKLDD